MTAQSSVSRRAAETRLMLDELTRRSRSPGTETGPSRRPFVTISRQAGARGAEIGRRLGEVLGWEVLGRGAVEALARELELDPRRLELLDETSSGWIRDSVLSLMDSRILVQDTYIRQLSRIVALAADRGRVILIGRGAHLLLPRDGGLRVRVVAHRDWRVDQFARSRGIGTDLAEKRVKALDQARRDFIRRHFRAEAGDESLFDLTLDVSVFGVEGCVEMLKKAIDVLGLGGGET